MFSKTKEKTKPSAEAQEQTDKAQRTIGEMLQGAFRMGMATQEALTPPRPVTFRDAVKALVQNEMERRALESEIKGLGFDLLKVKLAASLHVEAAEYDEATANK